MIFEPEASGYPEGYPGSIRPVAPRSIFVSESPSNSESWAAKLAESESGTPKNEKRFCYTIFLEKFGAKGRSRRLAGFGQLQTSAAARVFR